MHKTPIEHQRKITKKNQLRFLSKLRIKRKRAQRLNHNTISRNLPLYSECIQWISSIPNSLALEPEQGFVTVRRLKIPKLFSISENENESFLFIKNLFNALYNQNCYILQVDYGECQRIDLDASVCMDVILSDFIRYFNACQSRKIPVRIQEISPVRYSGNETIGKFLFSIGAFSSLKKVQLKYEDIITYPLCVGHKKKKNSDEQLEIDTTMLIEYLNKCLKCMDRELSSDEEKFFFQIIGEVMANAQEHATTNRRYSIGYFQNNKNSEEHIGVFSLVIMNFGATIYEKFKDADCRAPEVVKQMQNLSNQYTYKGFFRNPDFKEETLWTLYALQEGVTSTGVHRGSGTIKFAEGFFALKGDNSADNSSALTIISGNTRIIFDGQYGIVESQNGATSDKYKMLTFNNSGKISDKPDQKCVKFVSNYFPGTLIMAKIYIKNQNHQNYEH